MNDREEAHIASIWGTSDRSKMGRHDGRKNLRRYPRKVWRCCIIQQSNKSLGIKQLTTTESTEHAEKRDKTARFAPL